jgi:hypothetical protein
MSLRLCPSCSRHVREDACPFCGSEVPATVATTTIPRVARIALLGIGAAAVATACSGNAPAYGGPPDTGAGDSSSQDSGNDSMGTFYGAVPIDAGDSGD